MSAYTTSVPLPTVVIKLRSPLNTRIPEILISTMAMAEGVPVDQNILHPLTELLSEGVDCRDRPNIDQNAQPVLLDDKIYTKGRIDSSRKQTAWKCNNTPTKPWYPIPHPPGVDADDYVLAIYRSQLVWIGGRVHSGNQEEASKKVFVFEQDKVWKEDITFVPPLPVSLLYRNWHLFASGDDDYLVVAYDSKLLVFDGQQWQQRDGPKRDMCVLVHCGALHLIIQEDGGGSFCKVSMQSLLAENNYNWDSEMTKLPYASDIKYSSLTLVGDHVTMVASIYSGAGMSRTFCILSLSSASDSWIGLTQLSLDCYGIPSIVGCPNGTLFLMGLMKTKDSQSQNPSSAAALKQLIFSGQQATIPQFKMIKLAPNVLPYNPDGRISVAAVAKLDLHVGIGVLAKLSTNFESFKERAGFSITQNNPLPIPELYKESAGVKCIQCWVNDEKPSLPPTWNNFLQILRWLKLGDIANEIDHYLQSTAQMQQPEPNRDTTGLEDMAKLRSELESLQKKIVNCQEEEVQKLAGLVNSCVEKCRLSFDKVGKQIQDYEQNVRLLKEEKDSLSREYQRLNITEGQPSAKRQRIDKKHDELPTLDELLILKYTDEGKRHKIRIIKEASHKWKDIANLICGDVNITITLEDKCRDDPNECLKRTFIDYFINKKPQGYTQDWNGLTELLDDVDLQTLAEKVKHALLCV